MSIIQRFKQFLWHNPAAVFVLGFQALLVTCAVMLIAGMASLADSFGVVSYFLLVAAVVVQLVLFLRKDDVDSSG